MNLDLLKIWQEVQEPHTENTRSSIKGRGANYVRD
jgi:hypothetical protein